MSQPAIPFAGAGLARSRLWVDSTVTWVQRHRRLWPAAAIVAATVVAYHFTLASLFDYLRLETPLAYLPLLPLFALGIALITAQRYAGAEPMRDRQIDLLIGVPLLVAALALITVVPALASTYYWTNRPDVLSLAMFTSALVILFYGVTWFWRLKSALLFLVLMWPALYLHVMAGIMQSFTDATNGALASAVQHLPLGVTLGGQPGLLLLNPAHGQPLQVSVGTACSGADSVLGFVLIGSAILTTMRGGLSRKLMWLAAGLAVTFAANLLRLVSILALASAGHPELALGAYHAVIGLVLFAIVVTLMLRLLPLFGLRQKEPVTSRARASAPAAPRTPSVRRRAIVAGAVALLTIVVGLTDHGLAPYAAFEDGLGSPRVTPFSMASAPHGWEIDLQADYPWAKQYFGANSTFQRFTVFSSSSALMYADVVRTDDRGALDAYNLQNCFLFHNYNIVTSQRIDLGNGVTGLLLNYSDSRAHAKWATVSWAWPVKVAGETYFERVALTSNLYAGGGDANLEPSGGIGDFFISLVNLMNGGYSNAGASTVYKQADAELQGGARALIAHAVSTGG